jgi:CHASE3 domain sensor protein
VNDPWFITSITTFFTGVILGTIQTITAHRQRRVTDALAVSQLELQEQNSERDYQEKIIVSQSDYIKRLEERSEKLEAIVGQLRDEVREVHEVHDTCEDTKRLLRLQVIALQRRIESNG